MKIFKATRKYEQWLREELHVLEDDLALKAVRLADDPFTFLRGTFYRWMQLFPKVCKKIANAPVVLAVGDLHVGNFGTWRNAKDEQVWGINDFDEAAPLPYTLDLTRLAASVELASVSQELQIGLKEACEAILNGYQASLESGGKSFILNDENEWLEKIYLQNEKEPEEYWKKLDQAQDVDDEIPTGTRLALEASLPDGVPYRLKHRWAGIGSLGRERFTALAEWNGDRIAREGKPLLPSAAFWAEHKLEGAEIYYEEIMARVVRSVDPALKIYEGWVVRRLAPDSRRIELVELGPERDEARMMYAMGWEIGNIHLGTPSALDAILNDLKSRKKKWLVKAAKKMADATLNDWEMWKKGSP